jgi:hypothetical protein
MRDARPDLPQPVSNLVDVLAAMPGTVAVVLGGSRALGSHQAASDWDLGVYYRGAIDLTALSARGTGEFERDALLGCLCGVPTYSLFAELARDSLLPWIDRVAARLGVPEAQTVPWKRGTT